MGNDPASESPGRTAVLVIDMLNDLSFSHGADIRYAAEQAAEQVRALCGRARTLGVPVIYVNDNFGQWKADRSELIAHCGREGALGQSLVSTILPEPDDLLVIKPQFSGFYATNLPVLLPKLGVSRLVLTGIATEICVQFTAADAHMRDYRLWIPADCTASTREDRRDGALESMCNSMHAEIAATRVHSLEDWIDRGT